MADIDPMWILIAAGTGISIIGEAKEIKGFTIYPLLAAIFFYMVVKYFFDPREKIALAVAAAAAVVVIV